MPCVVDRAHSSRGELVLRSVGPHYEVISNGTFLMDTRNGESERQLVSAALAMSEQPHRVLIGGLGVGFSLVEALADPQVAEVVVVEIEPALVEWHRDELRTFSRGMIDDPRVTVLETDLLDHLHTTSHRYDVICLDIDNGPEWTVTDANAALYTDAGTAMVASRLRPLGVLSVWSAAQAPSYQAVLSQHFDKVAMQEIDVARGEPDVVYVATAPRIPRLSA